jgi:hypothetical protein
MSDLEARLRQAAQQLDSASAGYATAQPSPIDTDRHEAVIDLDGPTRPRAIDEPVRVRSIGQTPWTIRSIATSATAGLMVAAATLAVIVIARREPPRTNEIPGSTSRSVTAPTSAATTTAPTTTAPSTTAPSTTAPSTTVAPISTAETNAVHVIATNLDTASLLNGSFIVNPQIGAVDFVDGVGAIGDATPLSLQLGDVGDIDADGQDDVVVILSEGDAVAPTRSTLIVVEQRADTVVTQARSATSSPAIVYASSGAPDASSSSESGADAMIRAESTTGEDQRCPQFKEATWWAVSGETIARTDRVECVGTVRLNDQSDEEQELRLAKGTSTGLMEFTDNGSTGWFVANAEQRLTVKVRLTNSRAPAETVSIYLDGVSLGEAAYDAPLTITLPKSGRYEVRDSRPHPTERITNSPPYLSVEITID